MMLILDFFLIIGAKPQVFFCNYNINSSVYDKTLPVKRAILHSTTKIEIIEKKKFEIPYEALYPGNHLSSL